MWVLPSVCRWFSWEKPGFSFRIYDLLNLMEWPTGWLGCLWKCWETPGPIHWSSWLYLLSMYLYIFLYYSYQQGNLIGSMPSFSDTPRCDTNSISTKDWPCAIAVLFPRGNETWQVNIHCGWCGNRKPPVIFGVFSCYVWFVRFMQKKEEEP